MNNLPPFKEYKKKKYLDQSKVSQFVYQLGESSILLKPSKLVDTKKIKSKYFQKKIDYLTKCFKKYRKITGLGRGLAAVQVGIPERFAVVLTKDEQSSSASKIMVIINPKITKVSQAKLLYSEACMSAYPVVAPVIRPSWIEFEYLDENGQLKYWETKDNTKLGKILNRVFQHEIDHLDGIINIQKATSLKGLFLDSDSNFIKKAKFTKVN